MAEKLRKGPAVHANFKKVYEEYQPRFLTRAGGIRNKAGWSGGRYISFRTSKTKNLDLKHKESHLPGWCRHMKPAVENADQAPGVKKKVVKGTGLIGASGRCAMLTKYSFAPLGRAARLKGRRN